MQVSCLSVCPSLQWEQSASIVSEKEKEQAAGGARTSMEQSKRRLFQSCRCFTHYTENHLSRTQLFGRTCENHVPSLPKSRRPLVTCPRQTGVRRAPIPAILSVACTER